MSTCVWMHISLQKQLYFKCRYMYVDITSLTLSQTRYFSFCRLVSVSVPTQIHANKHKYRHTHTDIYICMQVGVYLCVCVCVCEYTCIYVIVPLYRYLGIGKKAKSICAAWSHTGANSHLKGVEFISTKPACKQEKSNCTTIYKMLKKWFEDDLTFRVMSFIKDKKVQ